MQEDRPRATGGKLRALLVAVIALVAGAAGWLSGQLFPGPFASISASDRKAIEAVVHDYIMANPHIIPDAMEALRRKENARQLADIADEVHAPFPGAVLGNPRGSLTLVEFSDFACGYCRKSVADIDALISRNPELRIVIRELPILGEHSVEAARMALAAADQGRYAQFHHAMFAAGRPDPATIEQAARQAGLDMEKARAAAQSERISRELEKNLALAQRLGFSGTPSWVAGDQLIAGAVGADELARAIDAMRGD